MGLREPVDWSPTVALLDITQSYFAEMLRDNIDNGCEGVHLFAAPLFCYSVVDMVLLRSTVEKLYLLQAVFK